MISKFKTPKAIASKKKIDKALSALGKSIGMDTPFFASITFDNKSGTNKVCP